MRSPRFKLTVYGRPDCHLCQDMQHALEELQEPYAFNFSFVDIDENPRLVILYGTIVPVLLGNGQEICRHHLDFPALKAFLDTRPSHKSE